MANYFFFGSKLTAIPAIPAAVTEILKAISKTEIYSIQKSIYAFIYVCTLHQDRFHFEKNGNAYIDIDI